jgi:polysaccharide biosynthesis protein PslG
MMNYMTRRPRAVTMLMACAALALGLADSASAKPVFGLQGMWPSDSASKLDQEFALAQSTGSKQLRIGAQWRLLQPNGPDAYDQSYIATLDRTIAAATAHKLKVVLFITQTPCWATTAPDSAKTGCTAGNTPYEAYRYPPADPTTFANVSAFLVKRYASALAAYEIWNEPDQVNENYWAGPDKIARYVAMTKAAYGPLKAAAPGVPVLAGSFVGGNGKWLQALYNAGIKGSYDGLAVHFYDLPLYSLKTTRQTQKANGDTKPQWLTEFGWNSCYKKGSPANRVQHRCVTPAVQATALRDLGKAIASTSWLKSAILYQARDENADYRFGLLDLVGKRKPAFATYRTLLTTRKGLKGGLPKPTIRLKARNGAVTASGRASIDDIWLVRAYVRGQLAYRYSLRSDRTGAWKLKLPKQLGTSKLRVRIQASWSSRIAATAAR